jgi:hypothetical protein
MKAYWTTSTFRQFKSQESPTLSVIWKFSFHGYTDVEGELHILLHHEQVLRNLSINADELFVRSDDVQSSAFNGLTLSLGYGVYDTWSVTICDLWSPRLNKL